MCLLVGVRCGVILLELGVSAVEAVEGTLELVGVALHISKRFLVLCRFGLLLVNHSHKLIDGPFRLRHRPLQRGILLVSRNTVKKREQES